jgi:hypothetical protein
MDWSPYTELLDALAQARRDAYESAPRTTPGHVEAAMFLAQVQTLNKYMAEHPTPVLSSLTPDTAVSGDPDFDLSCAGTYFTPDCLIMFGAVAEPTTFVSATELTTIVKPSLFAPAVVPVTVRNGPMNSDAVDFTFTAAAEPEAVTEEEPDGSPDEQHATARRRHGTRR